MSSTTPAHPADPAVAARPQSLRRDEAEARAAMLQVTGYDVTLDLADDEHTFASRTVVRFESAGGATFLDLKPVRLDAVSLDGRRLDVDLLARGRFPLETGPGPHEVVVDARMPFRNDGEGLHRSVDPADGRTYVYGMSFMDAAPTVLACFDQPDLKAPYTLHVRTPADWTVVGNAPATSPEPGHWEIGPTPPLSTYFVTLVAGPYHVVRDEHDGIPLGLSARRSLARHLDEQADDVLRLTRHSFDAMHRLFGIRYPFGDYHQAFVPEFNAGAMENPGCVTFRDDLVFTSRVPRARHVFRATTICHEMAHQWFGNITTPRWWDDLWLNESFAEYVGNRVASESPDFPDAQTALVSYARRPWGLRADLRPSTHPVAGNGAVDALAALQDFDGISYAKGSSILKQLSTSLGDDVFFGGVVDHLERHRFGNATVHDLVASWERCGAPDLGPTVEQWLRTAGPDVLEVDRDAGVLVRTPPDDHPADRHHRLEVGTVVGGRLEASPVDVTGARTPLGPLGAAVVVDPHEQSWAVSVPDATTMRALVHELPLVEDDALRAALWGSVRSGYDVARVDPDHVVDLLEAAFPVHDTEDSGRHLLPWVLGEVLPAASSGARERVHAAARACLESTGAAAPGGELQASALRSSLATCDDPDVLRGWLATPPPGVVVDDGMRWRLLTRLAVLGATDRPELDDALEAAPTTAARVEHARAVASLPTPEAKAFAWARLTGEEVVSNYELEAAGLGMWRGGDDQRALLEPYVERYAQDLPTSSRVHSGWLQAVAAASFFPRPFVDTTTRDLLMPLLDDGVLEPGVRRRVVDAVDDLERQLAVRAAFPHGAV